MMASVVLSIRRSSLTDGLGHHPGSPFLRFFLLAQMSLWVPWYVCICMVALHMPQTVRPPAQGVGAPVGSGILDLSSPAGEVIDYELAFLPGHGSLVGAPAYHLFRFPENLGSGVCPSSEGASEQSLVL